MKSIHLEGISPTSRRFVLVNLLSPKMLAVDARYERIFLLQTNSFLRSKNERIIDILLQNRQESVVQFTH